MKSCPHCREAERRTVVFRKLVPHWVKRGNAFMRVKGESGRTCMYCQKKS